MVNIQANKATRIMDFFSNSLLIVFLVTLILLYLKRIHSYWDRKGVYLPRKPRFLVGNAMGLLTGKYALRDFFKEIYDDCQRKSRKVGGFYFLTKPCLVIADLDLIRRIMNSDFEYFTDRIMPNNKSDPFNDHLSSLRGDNWKKFRAQISPAFTSAKTKIMFPSIEKCVDNLIEEMTTIAIDKQVFDVSRTMKRFSINTAGSSIFGMEYDYLKNSNSKFGYYVKRIFGKSLTRELIMLFSFFFPEVLSLARINFIRKDVADYFLKIVSQNIKLGEGLDLIRTDFLHAFIQLRHDGENNEGKDGVLQNKHNSKPLLSEVNVAANCIFLLFASYESSAALLTFCLYELSVNVNIQDKVRREIIQTVTRYNGQFSYNAINDMDFLERCLKETLRKYSSVPAHFRECTKQYLLPETNITIEKGSFIFIPVNGIHMDPKIFQNPEQFDPDRFLKENIYDRHSCAWIPFGFGPRMCIGLKRGMSQAKLSLAKLLRNFEFTLNHLTKVPITMRTRSFVTESKNDIWLNVKKIN